MCSLSLHFGVIVKLVSVPLDIGLRNDGASSIGCQIFGEGKFMQSMIDDFTKVMKKMDSYCLESEQLQKNEKILIFLLQKLSTKYNLSSTEKVLRIILDSDKLSSDEYESTPQKVLNCCRK